MASLELLRLGYLGWSFAARQGPSCFFGDDGEADLLNVGGQLLGFCYFRVQHWGSSCKVSVCLDFEGVGKAGVNLWVTSRVVILWG